MMRASVFRRPSPFLLLAAALVALALLFGPGAQPAEAQTPYRFAISNATAYQGGDAVLCIALSTSRSVTFNVTTNLASNDSSANANDVGTVPSTVTASTTTPCDNTLTIPISAAAANEPRESFQVTITSQDSQFSPAQTGANVATVVIAEQSYILYDVAVEEGETAVADVILTSPAPSGGLSFTVSAQPDRVEYQHCRRGHDSVHCPDRGWREERHGEHSHRRR